jgi:beta-glucosidase
MNTKSIVIGVLLTIIIFKSQAQVNMMNDSTEARAKEILEQMTLKQKVYEMHGHGLARFGLSILFSKKVKPVHAGGNKKFDLPSTIFLDGPRGVSFYKGTTAFPTTMARGASWDVDLERRIGEAMAKEVRALGANYSGAVCMNLLRHPAWGRSQETYGEDPHHLGEMASALVAGIQSHNVQACVKHFAVNSMENNRFGGSMNMDEPTLRDVYLPHFKKVIERGAASVMSAYNKVNGEYCGHSKYLLMDILRKEWGFKGYITSDWQNGLYDTKKGVEAGMNIEMPAANCYRLSNIKKLLKNGDLTEQQIDTLVYPIIYTKLLFASKKDKQTYPKSIVGCEAHVALAREATEKSAVLLKNESNILPLEKTSVKTIAVIGSLASVAQTGDHGSSRVFTTSLISPLEALQYYFEGSTTKVLTASNSDLAKVKEVSAQADVVLVVAGTTYLDEGEFIGNGQIRDKKNPNKKNFITKTGVLAVGGDRAYLHLHQADIDVIKAAASVNKKVVVSLVAGSAVTVEEWHEEVSAIIQTFYNGQEGGHALARLLFGEVNPSGKLPFTVPVSENDLPPFDSYAAEVDYGYYHGYTLLDKELILPRYPFGYGLSYTKFQLSDLQKELGDVLQLSLNVTNIGSREGAEVVQVYIGLEPQQGGSNQLDVPQKLLRGFAKVNLLAGEQKHITITIPLTELAHYDPEVEESVVLKGNYNFWVGNSSDDEQMLKGSFVVE